MGHGRSGGGAAPSGSVGRTAAGGAGAGAVLGGAVGASTGGGVQAGIVGSAEAMMTAAITMAGAAVTLPPALMIAFEFKLCSGKPQNIMKAAYGWDNAADYLQKAATELRDLVAALPEQTWSAQDRDRYESTVDEYSLQLDYLHNFCMAVSITLTVLAWTLFGYAVFAMGMATWLDALALAALDPLLTLECEGLAATAYSITTVATAALGVMGVMAGAALTGSASLVADLQSQHGNQYAKAAFDEAFKNGGKTALVNLAQDGINAGLAFLSRGDPADRKPSFPLKEIDLDADRDGEGAWSVGGGGKVGVGPMEHELNGHAIVNNGHVTGGDLEYKGKYEFGGTGHSVGGGGKLEWGKPGGNDGLIPDSVTGSAGYENSDTGEKAGVEGGYKEGNWEGKVQGGALNGTAEVGGSTKKPDKTPDETPPWDL
ncbi:hypothetical protein E1293_20565 [Actinomadura darangshiensis]|uniref:Uncharacterized protein n=1 Tax=Actinomadura darangshiensis TaxID=705336 RepID=A0A4R5B305_9ACTN|nr:hypothetical protein [Actinomadura darangshiensis]TDD80508.1 hypothetical protein E1293_20565 [Actinomadura darangshiensis]